MIPDPIHPSRVALITGGNSGLGLSLAIALAQQGVHVFITCRSRRKADRAIATIQAAARTATQTSTSCPPVEALLLDLASLESVRACAAQFRARQLSLDILVNNAGIFRGHGTTIERFERIWGTNYLGHVLLTDLLRDRLTPQARIVAIASDLAYRPDQLDWNVFTQPTPWNFLSCYSLSKLCLLLWVRELDRCLRLDDPQPGISGITINALHPGFVRSNISFGHQLASFFGVGTSPEEVACTAIALLTDPAWQTTSGTFVDRHLQPLPWPTLAEDSALATELWQRSQAWTGGNRPHSFSDECRTASQSSFSSLFSQPSSSSSLSSDAAPLGDREISPPLRLSLSREVMEDIAQTIQRDVLPRAPLQSTLLQLLKFLLRLKFGSFFLLCVQLWKGEFYMERHLDSEAVQRLCQDPELLRYLRQQLGDELTLWRSEIWANYPAQQLIPFWHRDLYPKLLSGAGRSLNAYIALSDVSADNGFEYIPGAALNENNHTVQLSDPFSGNNLFEIDAAVEQQAVPVVLQAGEFVLFTDRLVHRSIRNTSGRVRLSIVLRITQTSVQASGYTSATGSSSVTLSSAMTSS